MQKRGYDIIKAHHEKPCPQDAMFLLILGVGGTGKSYPINAIQNLLQHSCAVAPKTGKASSGVLSAATCMSNTPKLSQII